jgi:hypothetical protein
MRLSRWFCLRQIDPPPHLLLPRPAPFFDGEFETAFKTQGKYISPVLLELGWQRRRIWSTTGKYHRYWEPPGWERARFDPQFSCSG